MREVILYIDYKSPFSYLAKDPAHALEEDFDVRLDWRHFTFPIAEAFDAVAERSDWNWRKIRYLYMDARRLANKRGLTVRGPKIIFDSRPAGIGLYFAQAQGEEVLRGYSDRVFERFFKRELDLGDGEAVAAALAEAGADIAGFAGYLAGDGMAHHDRIVAEAEELGVFGVPTFVFEGELFWGTDRMDLLRERVAGG